MASPPEITVGVARMTQKLLLGLDVSTTGAKALLIDSTGRVVSSASTALSLSTPRPLWSEQNPTDWWAGDGQQHPAGAGPGRGKRRGVAAIG
jgi:glycerol kinase